MPLLLEVKLPYGSVCPFVGRSVFRPVCHGSLTSMMLLSEHLFKITFTKQVICNTDCRAFQPQISKLISNPLHCNCHDRYKIGRQRIYIWICLSITGRPLGPKSLPLWQFPAQPFSRQSTACKVTSHHITPFYRVGEGQREDLPDRFTFGQTPLICMEISTDYSICVQIRRQIDRLMNRQKNRQIYSWME